VRNGVPVAAAKGTVGQFLDFWLEKDVQPNRTPATHKCYADTIRLHIGPRLGGVRLAEFGSEHVVGLYAALCRTGVGARTRELVHSVLRRAMRKAHEWGRLRANPVLGVGRPKVPKKERTALSPEQARALFTAAAGHRLESLFVLAVTSGLRQGELFALAWRDVDIPGKRLRVRHSLEELNGKLRL
jgi:integrase